MSGEEVRFNVKMPQTLRDDAKRNAERGELSEEVRKLFRRKAYGLGDGEFTTELEETEAELEATRNELDDLRRERNKIEAQISSKEARENRLVEKRDRLKEREEKQSQTIEMLENMLQDGERIYPARIENYADVAEEEAMSMLQKLKDRNPEVPSEAFELSSPNEPLNWKQATNNTTQHNNNPST
jgi:chromosome segregation ATPase